MNLTLNNVKALLNDCDMHRLEITKHDDGIRIFKEEWGHDENTIVGTVMKAARAVELSPEQVIDNTHNEEGTADTMGYASTYMVVDVTFLFPSPATRSAGEVDD